MKALVSVKVISCIHVCLYVMPRKRVRGEARLVLLSGRVPESLRKRFKMFCSATGKTEQEALTEAIEEYLKSHIDEFKRALKSAS